jgi:hypothetical protein
MEAFMDRFKDWAPRAHEGKTPEDHMARMYSVGHVESKIFYFNPVISALSAGIIWAFVIWAMVRQEDAAEDVSNAQGWVTDIWNWLYMFSQNIWLVVLFYVLYKYSDLKLRKDEDVIEFSDCTYFAMLFSCGVATGLWTAEAMWHYEGYATPRWMDKSMFNDNTRAEHSLMVTFFHWGIHGWIPYVVIGALISILTYRRGFPMSMRFFTLYPLFGEIYALCDFCGDVMWPDQPADWCHGRMSCGKRGHPWCRDHCWDCGEEMCRACTMTHDCDFPNPELPRL